MSAYPWGHDRPFNAYANYFKARFGSRVQKLSLNAGFTCPNRDGRLSYGGCTYCDNAAFNPSYCQPEKSITQQLSDGIAFHQARYGKANRYLAYFQAYSNTYAPMETLKRLYGEALAREEVLGLVIGTRPDCIDEEKLAYLARLAETHYVIIEYGVESCNDNTLARIRRGHDFGAAVRALELTRKMGLPAGAHFIFGLPGERPEEWMDWASVLSELPITTLKFHQLQILKNTPMAALYREHPEDFALLSLPEYVDFMVDFMERLHPAFIVERFAGEVPPRYLEANPWEPVRNERMVQIVERRLLERRTWQGRLYVDKDSLIQ